MDTCRIGLIGCGDISGQYIATLAGCEGIEIAACASRGSTSARRAAQEHGIAKACTTEELLADPDIEVVVNLTTPAVHAEVTLAALAAGKHVYSEKPLAVTREDGRRILDTAAAKGLRVGCAPDTVLGGAHQTCRALIDAGVIGQPVAATAFMMCRGHESWHPSPEFYYKVGGGPMFDMGPYYLADLIMLLGAVRRVTASARATFPTRTITSSPLAGTEISVDVPTHVAGILDFECGAIGTIVTSFDVWAHTHSHLEIYGTLGTLIVPDPNGFGGMVQVRIGGGREWEQRSPSRPFVEEGMRGLGVIDLVHAIRTGRPHRIDGEFAFHVLDIMHALHEASEQGRHIEVGSRCRRPEPLSVGAALSSMD